MTHRDSQALLRPQAAILSSLLHLSMCTVLVSTKLSHGVVNSIENRHKGGKVDAVSASQCSSMAKLANHLQRGTLSFPRHRFSVGVSS